MHSIPALTIEDVAAIDNILREHLARAEAELVVVIDRGGNLLAQVGDREVMDATIIAALAAGSFARPRNWPDASARTSSTHSITKAAPAISS